MSNRLCLSGTPSAMITTTLIVSDSKASLLVSYADLNDEKFISTSALGCFFKAKSNVLYTGITISRAPQNAL